MDIYSCLEASAEHGYNTVLQCSTNKGAANIQVLQIKTEQNIVAALNDNVSLLRVETRRSINRQNKAKHC